MGEEVVSGGYEVVEVVSAGGDEVVEVVSTRDEVVEVVSAGDEVVSGDEVVDSAGDEFVSVVTSVKNFKWIMPWAEHSRGLIVGKDMWSWVMFGNIPQCSIMMCYRYYSVIQLLTIGC